ncbi:MAG: T9SS type A sorting domain-containing protein, partial [Ferruginibacter sp.]
TLQNTGQSDFFVAKYGNTNCTLSVAEQEASNLVAYPNPTKGLVQFSNAAGFSKIQVFSPLGQLVLEKTAVNEVDLARFATGIYLVKLFDGDKVSVIKVMKE